MSVCVRLAKDVVAEFRNIAETVEFLTMIGLATKVQPAGRKRVERLAAMAAPAPPLAPSQSVVTGGADSSAHAELATDATLAELQASSDQAAAAGCRAA